MFRVADARRAKRVQDNAALGCGAIVAVQAVLIEQRRDILEKTGARGEPISRPTRRSGRPPVGATALAARCVHPEQRANRQRM